MLKEVHFKNFQIINNTSPDISGIVHIVNSSIAIHNTTISHNIATRYGYITFAFDSDIHIQNSIINFNRAYDSSKIVICTPRPGARDSTNKTNQITLENSTFSYNKVLS